MSLYIVHTDFNGKSISGEVNLVRGTICTEDTGTIYHKGKPICLVSSDNACKYFAKNDDGKGLERGDIITKIKTLLSTNDENSEARWKRLTESKICRQFNRGGNSWNWNLAFYHAPIVYLNHILNIVIGDNNE